MDHEISNDLIDIIQDQGRGMFYPPNQQFRTLVKREPSNKNKISG